MAVYLIHFDQRYRHAGHYLGYSSDLEGRIRAHRESRGARLMEVINELGIHWRVVRIWPDGGYELERTLKSRHNGPRLCPICNPAVAVVEEQEACSVVPVVETLDAEAFGTWLARWADAVVGWSDESLNCPLGHWLAAMYGGEWQVNARSYRWREGERTQWLEWQALPPWAVSFLNRLYQRFGDVAVCGREAYEVLGWSLADVEYWQQCL